VTVAAHTGRLTPRQARFVAEYLIDLKAGPAAIRAGYSAKTAETCGPRLLRNAQVTRAVEEGMAKRRSRMELSADRVLLELMRVAMSDLSQAYDKDGRLLPVQDMPEDCRRAIAGIKVFEEFDGYGEDRVKVGEVREVKFWDKPRSLELLGKHLGTFTERVELSVRRADDDVSDEEWTTLAQLRHDIRGAKPDAP
jgi:phage terminase small subunit